MVRESAWQGRQDSNLQLTVLETATLPIELLPYARSACLVGGAVVATALTPTRALRSYAPRPHQRYKHSSRCFARCVALMLLLGFAVCAGYAAVTAKLFELETLGVAEFVLLRVVVTTLTFLTSHDDHDSMFFLSHPSPT